MKFHKKKREQVLEQMCENSIAVLTAGPLVKSTSDETYPFCVNRNFYYLTGIDEQNVVLVLVKSQTNREILYIKKANPEMEKWYGKTISAKEATEVSNVEEIHYIDDFNDEMKEIIEQNGIKTFYVDDEQDPIIHFSQDIIDSCEAFDELEEDNIYPIIAKMRTIKEPEEIAKMREAIEITKEGITNMLNNFQPGLKEHELEAYYDFILKKHQVPTSFKTIAAGGVRGTILHYSANNNVIKDNDLILFDLGVAKNRYCSDITRTFPINGKFSDKQRMVYDIVLRTQKKVEEACKPGVTLAELQQITIDSYKEELFEIGLIKEKTLDEVRKYYWHSISHSLGLDTHDVGLGRNDELKPGMVITNEPGLYIEEWEIGIRIEDDLLVTEDGCENLSRNIIKDPDEIESYLKK